MLDFNDISKVNEAIRGLKPVPMQDFAQVSSQVGNLMVAISINCLNQKLYQVRIHAIGDLVSVDGSAVDIGSLCFTGTKEEVIVWTKAHVPMFAELVDKEAKVL